MEVCLKSNQPDFAMKITLLPLFGLIVSAFALPSLAQRPEGREREEHGERGRLEGMGRSGGDAVVADCSGPRHRQGRELVR